jgi:hypothetical protein
MAKRRMRKKANKREQKALEKDFAESYNHYKTFEGHQYTGMKIGRSHKWYYDQGIWKDKKLTPDQWEIEYSVTKRRAGKAPEGSGAAVGTKYHWYIIAHQIVTKLDANDYSTSINGMKFKLAHKRAGKETWSASTKTQRKKAIKILKKLLAQMEEEQRHEDQKVIPFKPAAKKKASKRISKKKIEEEAA